MAQASAECPSMTAWHVGNLAKALPPTTNPLINFETRVLRRLGRK